MTLGLTASNSVRIRVDLSGLRAVSCGCCCIESSAYNFVLSNFSLVGETCTITNESDAPACLSGWLYVSVVGRSGNYPQEYWLPEWIIAPQGQVVLTSGGSGATTKPNAIHLTTAFIYNNAGDTSQLYAPDGTLVSSISA
jgi:hypothetical protein